MPKPRRIHKRLPTAPKAGPLLRKPIDRLARTLPNGLTPLQDRWLAEWIKDTHGDPIEAARRAGAQGDDADLKRIVSRWRQDPYVRARLDEFMRGNTLSADETLAALSREATRAVDARDRVRALELLAKYHGLQTEQVAVRALPQDPKQLDDLLMMELSRVKGIPVALLAPAKRGQRLKDPLTDPRADEAEQPDEGGDDSA